MFLLPQHCISSLAVVSPPTTSFSLQVVPTYLGVSTVLSTIKFWLSSFPAIYLFVIATPEVTMSKKPPPPPAQRVSIAGFSGEQGLPECADVSESEGASFCPSPYSQLGNLIYNSCCSIYKTCCSRYECWSIPTSVSPYSNLVEDTETWKS